LKPVFPLRHTATMSHQIRSFKIAVPDEAIDAVRSKLAEASFPDEVDFSDDWEYGASLRDVKRLAKHWAEGFDWRAQEAKLNSLPHFKTSIFVDGFGALDIHFVHQTSSKPGSIPLLFCHGCTSLPFGPFHMWHCGWRGATATRVGIWTDRQTQGPAASSR